MQGFMAIMFSEKLLKSLKIDYKYIYAGDTHRGFAVSRSDWDAIERYLQLSPPPLDTLMPVLVDDGDLAGNFIVLKDPK